ncbi:hypothetical protein Tsubulata_015502, partial [Turnera subulata]
TGTISGIGRYLKEKNPKMKVIGVEPTKSNIFTGGKLGNLAETFITFSP